MDFSDQQPDEQHDPSVLGALPSTLPESETHEAQLAEFSSTIDPSHVIHLIRQLLPATAAKSSFLNSSSGGGLQLSDDPQNGLEPYTQETEEQKGLGSVRGKISEVHIRHDVGTEQGGGSSVRYLTDSSAGQLVDDAGASHCEENDYKNAQETESGGEVSSGPVAEVGDVRAKDDSGSFNQELGASEPLQEEKLREEAGCVLWDLATNEAQADFLVDNHILDVLLATLSFPKSDRLREISLGILGNLACHSKPEKAMVTIEGLVQTIIQQLHFDDPPSLCETCRLLSAGLHGGAASAWIDALKEDVVLERILWMTANTMNAQLREKSTELLLAMVDSKREAMSILLPTLLQLGLPDLLTDLIDCEVSAITEGASSCGDAVLDIVLQVAEALSLSDEFATQLASNQTLFSLTCQVIRLSYKDDIGPSCITGTVLIANLLTEERNLIHNFLQDGTILARLLGLLPTVSDDSGARNALWSILERVCWYLQTSRSQLPFNEQASLMTALADGSNSLLDDLDDHRDEDEDEDEKRTSNVVPSCGRQSKLATVVNVVHVMEDWLATNIQTDNRWADVVRTVQSACQLLGNYTASPDSVMHEQVQGRGSY